MYGEARHIIRNIIYDPSKYTKDHPDLAILKFMESSIGLKRVKHVLLREKNVIHDMEIQSFYAL